MQSKWTLQENWETRIFDMSASCILQEHITRIAILYIVKNRCIGLMKQKSGPIIVQLSGTEHTTE